MNVYEIVTSKIVELLEEGTIPWRKPWRAVQAQNLMSRKEYRGVNALLLNSLPFSEPYFLTFKQARALGGSVVKGARGLPVVFWQMLKRKNDKNEETTFPLLRYYTVFNIAQTEGIEIPQ